MGILTKWGVREVTDGRKSLLLPIFVALFTVHTWIFIPTEHCEHILIPKRKQKSAPKMATNDKFALLHSPDQERIFPRL